MNLAWLMRNEWVVHLKGHLCFSRFPRSSRSPGKKEAKWDKIVLPRRRESTRTDTGGLTRQERGGDGALGSNAGGGQDFRGGLEEVASSVGHCKVKEREQETKPWLEKSGEK